MGEVDNNNRGNCGFADVQELQGEQVAESQRSIADALKPKQFAPKITGGPTPLPQIEQQRDYPVDALGDLLGGAAKALASHIQAPVAMAGQSVLSAAALAVQGHINVARGNIGVCPVSIFAITIAESGDRKSAVDKLALAPIKEFEARRISEFNDQKAEYEAAFQAWKTEREQLISSYKKRKPMTSNDRDMLENDLRAIEKKKPKEPEFPNITFAEPTPAAIWRHFQYGLPSAGLFSDEGIEFFSGYGMRDESKGVLLGELCKLWDGSPLIRTRAERDESGVMSDRRLSGHLMVQPVVAEKFLNDALLNHQGLLPRFLFAFVESMAGTRYLKPRNPATSIESENAYAAYSRRISEILDTALPIDAKTGALIPNIWQIRGEAYDSWVDVHDVIERRLGPGGDYACIKASAAKAGEQIARIAAIFAYIEQSELICPNHVERAAALVIWHLDCLVVRVVNSAQGVEAVEAATLFNWIKSRSGTLKAVDFKKLPSHLRSAKTARARLDLLVEMGHITVIEINTRGVPSCWAVLEH